MPGALHVPLPTLDATNRLATALSASLGVGVAMLLSGDLGSGKSTFVRALLKAAGASGEIPSPTFTLVQSYDLPQGIVSHFDLYRLNSAQEVEEIGFHDALADGAVLVEWPEKAAAYMPANALRLRFVLTPQGGRYVEISGPADQVLKVKGLENANEC